MEAKQTQSAPVTPAVKHFMSSASSASAQSVRLPWRSGSFSGHDSFTNSPAETPACRDSLQNSLAITPARSVTDNNEANEAAPASVSDPYTFVCIQTERENPETLPGNPSFIDQPFDPENIESWYNIMLPWISTLTFTLSSTTDVHYLGTMLSSTTLPDLHIAIKKIQFPNFFWFSGARENRQHNPSLKLCTMLAHLEEITLTLHTAGFTVSRFTERDRVFMEQEDLERSKELRVLRVNDVVQKYDLGALLMCRNLRVLRLECICSESVAYFCKYGDPVELFSALVAQLHENLRTKVNPEIVVSGALVERG